MNWRVFFAFQLAVFGALVAIVSVLIFGTSMNFFLIASVGALMTMHGCVEVFRIGLGMKNKLV
jgi:hypothetical protein